MIKDAEKKRKIGEWYLDAWKKSYGPAREVIRMANGDPKQVVARLWERLYRKDWDGVAACIADDGLYQDVPAPDRGAVGPANVVKRLRVGLVVFDAGRSCGVRLERQTAPTEGIEVLGLETLDRLAGR